MGARRGRRTSIGEQFAVRTIRMLESPAWRVLSLSARRVIERIEIELGHHGGNDNGNLPVTYADFEEYGIERAAIGMAIREAVALGFVEITSPGVPGSREHRAPNKFRLTYLPAKGIEQEHGKGFWQQIETMEQALDIKRFGRSNRSPRRSRPTKTFIRARHDFQ